MTHTGENSYLYYFTYAETGKRRHLGAYHGVELKFLSDSFPSDWERSPDDEKLGRATRAYWTQFAKTGNPNAPGLSDWPAYDAKSDQCFELGRSIRIGVVESRLKIFDRIMRQIFAEAGKTELHDPKIPANN